MALPPTFNGRRMQLGPGVGDSRWAPGCHSVRDPWPPYWRESNWYADYLQACASAGPYFRYHEDVDRHRTYKPGPRPYKPGRYMTSKWEPWKGLGRFSRLAEILDGAYHAERYTGWRIRPEDYPNYPKRPVRAIAA